MSNRVLLTTIFQTNKLYHSSGQKARKKANCKPFYNSIKILKIGHIMAVKRKTYNLCRGDIIEVEEFHDGNYGAPGKERKKKKKPTTEQMQRVNAHNKFKRCRLRLLQYFDHGDCFATWTYEEKNRPPSMEHALKDFQEAIRYVRKEYKKRGKPLLWIRNIERGTKGAWHIHLIVNEIGETASILQHAWKHGGTYTSEIRKNSKIYAEDFSKLASYITKDEYSREKKKDGTPGKPRLKEANYGTSRNMPLPEPTEDKLIRWKKEAQVKKGYYILSSYEGINPVTGFKYRRYTMMRLFGKEEDDANGRHLHRNKLKRQSKGGRKSHVCHVGKATERKSERKRSRGS